MNRVGLVVLSVFTIGAVILTARKGKAASTTPNNVSMISTKLGAIGLGAQLVAGGTWIVVASDPEHRSAVDEVVRRRAAAHPDWKYVVMPLALARELAAERAAVEIPAEIWGGVAAIKDGELIKHTFFPTTDAIADAEERIASAEGMVPALGDASLAIPSIAAGMLVRVDSGPPAPRARPGIRRRFGRR